MPLRELQHRAKNNLALVTAMLARERRTVTAEQDMRATERLGKLMQRVTAIALAQDRLAAVEGGGGQGFELLRHLARQLGGEIELGTPERSTSITFRFPLVIWPAYLTIGRCVGTLKRRRCFCGKPLLRRREDSSMQDADGVSADGSRAAVISHAASPRSSLHQRRNAFRHIPEAEAGADRHHS